MVRLTVVNVTQALVQIMFEDESLTARLVCDCQQCRDDIVALTLNRLPSRYVSTNQGQAYVKAQYLSTQLQSDILRELTVAMNHVGAHPRHGEAVQPAVE